MERTYKDSSDETSSLIDVDTPHVASVESSFLNQDIKTSTQAERLEREEEAASEARKAAGGKGKAKEDQKSRRGKLRRNSDNPVVLGNAALIALVGAGLGVGAFRRYVDGRLSGGVVAGWAGVIGVVGVADYFFSK